MIYLRLSLLNNAALVGKSASFYKRYDGTMADEQLGKAYVKATARYNK